MFYKNKNLLLLFVILGLPMWCVELREILNKPYLDAHVNKTP